MDGPITLFNHNTEYDTLHPIEEVERFCKFLQAVKERYEGNEYRLKQLQIEETDLHHAIELAQPLSKSQKTKLFRKLRENLIERRQCKSENDLLAEVYQRVEALQWLRQMLGRVRMAKTSIDNRMYQEKSGILQDILSDE